MAIASLFSIALIAATLFCTMVTGLLFCFAVVAMPGISQLNDREFIRAFQVMDGVIQRNQPLFMIVWVGSVLLLLGATALGLAQLGGLERALLVGAALIYLFGVQLPTVAINVPLNNRLQALDVDAVQASAHAAARSGFEARWNRWNRVRTLLAGVASTLLLILLLRL